jgi:nucleoside-diphosphate-sugar epimerase
MRVLVTGGTGFIGSHLVEELLRRGHQVLCLVREKLRWLEGLPVELCFGDLRETETLRGAVEGLDCVYHLAGLVKACSPQEFLATNHHGTRNLLQACLEAHSPPHRFIYMSSLAALGPSFDGRPLKEEEVPHPVSPYGLSKLKGEEEVLAQAKRLHVVVIRPPAVYGPRDRDLYTFFRLVQHGIVLVVGFRRRDFSLCYVEDLIQGLLLAGEGSASSGQIYHIAGEETYSWEEAGEIMAQTLQVQAIRVRIPTSLLSFMAGLGEVWGRLRGRPALLDRGKAREMAFCWMSDISKARRELGFRPRFGFQEGIRLTVHWYRKEGWL